MSQTQDKGENKNFQPAQTGNASNPSEKDGTENGGNQLLDEKAEKYLREVANIEDVPDAQDQQEMDDVIEEEKNK
jgi:hypothetical protein